jgi:hypothetical protein
MEIKTLDFKNYHHVRFDEIEKKYKEEFNSEPMGFSESELKSILALIFSIQFHYPVSSNDQIEKVNDILYERHRIINLTTRFGRQMIENLDYVYLEWFNELLNRRYHLFEIIKDIELNNFVHLAVTDYMSIRKIEFGKFFLNEWSKSIIDTSSYYFDSYSRNIKKYFEDNPEKIWVVAEKIEKANPSLTIREGLLLIFTLKEYFIKPNNSIMDYTITNYIVRDNIHELNLKRSVYMSTIREVLNQKWNLNRGKGGPKL